MNTTNNNWFNEVGNLKISSEEFYCTMIYPWDGSERYEIKPEIVEFVTKNFASYGACSDIVAINYALDFAKETKNNYSACCLLCRSGVTENADWDRLEERHFTDYV